MSAEDLKKDVEEITTLLAQAKRQRVKNILMIEKHKIETELVNCEIKEHAAKENKTKNLAPSIVGSAQKRYLVELNEYAWDQSDKYVKLFITLDGVQNLTEDQVTATFTDKSLVLQVNGLNNKDYRLTINNLLNDINAEASYRKIKTGMIAIYMKKQVEGLSWSHLTVIEKRLKDKHDADMKAEMSNGEDAMINMMKRMFQSGDPETKKIIAKAWTESQDALKHGKKGE